MQTLHVCIKDGEILTEITGENEPPTFSPTKTATLYFTVKIDPNYVHRTEIGLRDGISVRNYLEWSTRQFLQMMQDQEITITPPDKK